MKRHVNSHTERWPAVVPTAYAVRQRELGRRWSDQDIFVAALCGGITALLLVATLALVILAGAS